MTEAQLIKIDFASSNKPGIKNSPLNDKKVSLPQHLIYSTEQSGNPADNDSLLYGYSALCLNRELSIYPLNCGTASKRSLENELKLIKSLFFIKSYSFKIIMLYIASIIFVI